MVVVDEKREGGEGEASKRGGPNEPKMKSPREAAGRESGRLAAFSGVSRCA
jgi:hypothetical protein